VTKINRGNEPHQVVLIQDVARRAGVSRATVSKALNEATMSVIAVKTREKVRQAADELGYHPSALARGLSRKRMDTIGVILPPGEYSPSGSPFFSVLFNGVLKAAHNNGQNVTLLVGDTWRDAKHSLPRFRDGRCDGFLVFYQPDDSDLITALLDSSTPVVLVNDRREDARLSYVDVDNQQSSRRMTEYLIGLGHSRIALMTDNDVGAHYVAERIAGYNEAAICAGLTPQEIIVPWTDESGEPVIAAIRRIVETPPEERPTALFCTGDSAAGFAIAALQKHGLSVPGDISVAGFNDDEAAHKIVPALTTMRQPFTAIGEQAVALLLEQINDRSQRGQQILLPTELIVRDSTTTAP